MSDETRNRIKDLADEMGYVPNSNARSLVGGKTQLISISMPGIGPYPEVMRAVEYYFRLLGAIASKALELNHGLLVTSSSNEAGRVAVDGAVVVDPPLDDPTIAVFDRIGLPVVTIGRRLGDNVNPEKDLVVDNDFTVATGDVLDHLRERGARSITLFAAEPIDSFQRDTIDSYLEWCGRHDVESRVVMSDSPGVADAEKAARNVVTESKRPDGVYATVDTLAEALLSHVEGEGMEVPGDIRISTCSDGQIAKSTSPKLTTIDERPVELGEAAVNMLIAAINDEDVAPSHVQVGTELLIRESTA